MKNKFGYFKVNLHFHSNIRLMNMYKKIFHPVEVN